MTYRPDPPGTKSLILRGLPRELFERAGRLSRAEVPGLNLKQKIVELIAAYVEYRDRTRSPRDR